MSDSRLLNYMSNKEVRANLIAKLIELITPDTLNQVISGTSDEPNSSKFSGYILENMKKAPWKFQKKLSSKSRVIKFLKENVSCLNTSLVFMITARREGTLAYYLSDLAQRRNDIGVPLLENYQVFVS